MQKYRTLKIRWDRQTRICNVIIIKCTHKKNSNSNLKITQDYFPSTQVKQELAVQIAASGPDTDWANIMEAIFVAINTADHYVYITTPYFIMFSGTLWN